MPISALWQLVWVTLLPVCVFWSQPTFLEAGIQNRRLGLERNLDPVRSVRASICTFADFVALGSDSGHTKVHIARPEPIVATRDGLIIPRSYPTYQS